MTNSGTDVRAWTPIHVSDPQEISALTADTSVEVFDTVEQQRRDFARTLPVPDPADLSEPTRWYYYPWRRAIVHVLGPLAFHALRTDRNRNKITVEQQQQLRKLTVGVVGLSSGHAIAHTLALEGICGRLVLADFDHVELSNLNRIPGTVFDLGVNKAVVTARRISELDPYIDIVARPAGLRLDSADEFMKDLDVVIEQCDSFDVKLAVRQAARRTRIPLIMETNDRGLLDVERYDFEPDRPLFHGLLGATRPEELMGLTTHQKIPYVLRTLEPDQLSAIIAASMTEVDETLSTWPQLGGDVGLGAATVAAAVRRLGLGENLPSGRVRVDVDAALSDVAEPTPGVEISGTTESSADPEPAPGDAVGAVVHAVRLAPSGGNTQPWSIHHDHSELQIRLDPAQTSTLDVAFRGSHLAIGAALFNARVAAARRGILGKAEIFPGGEDSAPVARLRFGNGDDPELSAVYEAMVQRVSNRHLTEAEPLPSDVVPAIRAAAEEEGAAAYVVTDRVRLSELAEVLGESDRVRYLTEHLHREMMRELRWPGIDSLDWGLDVRTLELDESDLAKLSVARRGDVMAVLADQDLGRALGESTRDRINGASGLVVVSIDGSTARDYVLGGQAVERVWIEAQRRGLAVQAMSPVFIFAVDHADYEELSPRFADRLRRQRKEFAELTEIGNRRIALVLRIGYAPNVSVRSARLPAERTVRAL